MQLCADVGRGGSADGRRWGRGRRGFDWREDVEGRVCVGRLRRWGEARGGEDGFKLAGADDCVDLGDVLLDLVAVALDQAAGDDEALGFAAVLLLVLDHLEDGVDGLLLGGVDEAAGVDDEDLGVFGVGGELAAGVVEQAHHDLGVDEVLGAAEGDEADLGTGLEGVWASGTPVASVVAGGVTAS